MTNGIFIEDFRKFSLHERHLRKIPRPSCVIEMKKKNKLKEQIVNTRALKRVCLVCWRIIPKAKEENWIW